MTNEKLNELTKNFADPDVRKTIMKEFGDEEFPYFGVNADGEDTRLSISKDSMALVTNQQNGWVRIDYYDANGNKEGTTYDGRWK